MVPGTADRGGDVLIVIPALNEQDYIRDIIYSIQSDLNCADALIVVADDGSSDATVAIVEQIGRSDPRVVVLTTSKPSGVSAAVNRAVNHFGAGFRWLVRVDAHAEYPPNYASRLVQVAIAQGATAVVTAMTSRGDTCFQLAAAASQNSFLGTGGSAHRMVGGAGSWVEHGHHALVALDTFIAIGGYDETFTHNEDAEFDHRLLNAGGRIWLEPDLSIVYYPRKTYRRLRANITNMAMGVRRRWRAMGGGDVSGKFCRSPLHRCGVCYFCVLCLRLQLFRFWPGRRFASVTVLSWVSAVASALPCRDPLP
jgi:succinoglycan biosynthesis protein ExoA